MDSMINSLVAQRNAFLGAGVAAADDSSFAEQTEIFCQPVAPPRRKMNYSLPKAESLHASHEGLCRNCVAFAYGFSPNLFRRAEGEIEDSVCEGGVRYPGAPNIQRLLPLNPNTYFGDTHTLEDIEAIYSANGLDAGNVQGVDIWALSYN